LKVPETSYLWEIQDMKKIIATLLLTAVTTTAFITNNQPVQAHFRNHDRDYRRDDYRYFRRVYPTRYCYPITRWSLNQDPAYHPRAYSDGYRQGQESAKNQETYKPRTAGGEFSRGFEDGYYGKKFSGQQRIVANEYIPFTTNECSWY
jgi:hypothetical protein